MNETFATRLIARLVPSGRDGGSGCSIFSALGAAGIVAITGSKSANGD